MSPVADGINCTSKARVIIVDDEPITRMDLREMLEAKGYLVVAEAGDGETAVKVSLSYNPDVVLMDIRMPYMDGIEAATLLSEKCKSAIIFLTAYSDISLIEQAKNIPTVVGYVVKPIREEILFPCLEVGISCFSRLNSLEKEKEKLKESLEARKVIEKAKGILMEKYGWSESFAYKKIQRTSMNQRKPMKEIAQRIICGAIEEEMLVQ